MAPPTLFTIPVLRYMKTYGLTNEQLAMVSVVQREWAAKNPRATFKTPITVEDVLNSRMIAYPFRLLQCCLVTDGGGAPILVAAERARDFPQKPVYLLGTGESVETPMVSQMEDFTSSRAFRVAGPTAFAEAGITHKDVDHLMIYDAPVRCQGQASRICRSTPSASRRSAPAREMTAVPHAPRSDTVERAASPPSLGSTVKTGIASAKPRSARVPSATSGTECRISDAAAGSIRICPSSAEAQSREAKFTTVPIAV
jgi:hypothetical protein